MAPTPQLDDAATPTDGARAYDAAPPAEQACGSLAPIAKCGVAIEPSPPPAPDTTTCAKRFGDRGEQLVQSVFVDGSGNIRVIGTFEGNVDFGGGVRSSLGAGVPGGPPSTLFVAAYDPSCQLIWSKQLADSIGVFDRAGGVLITQSSNKNVWFDPAGNVIAEVEMIAPIMPPVTAADPEGGIAIATAAYQTAQGGGGGALVHSGALSRFDHTGKLVWTVSLDDYAAPVIVTIDRQGNVLVADTTRHSLSKYAASNGTKLWCLAEATQAKWASLVVDGDGGARLSSVLDTKLDILEVTAAGCVRRRRRLQLPPTMAFTTSYKGAATGLNGSVAVAPSGEVYVATANEHIETASFASDDTLVATGVYARKGRHPAPANAYGPSGELVLAGGFTQVDMDLGTLALSNAFAWSTDAFFVKN
ncbi:MAG: hypothetical protein JWP87_2685, partial [Labilithrix sp.]|nr:hypothetical protein [Labilithrix sp.]